MTWYCNGVGSWFLQSDGTYLSQHIPEVCSLNNQHCENLKPCMLSDCRFFFIRIIYNTSFCQAYSEDNFWYEAEKSVCMYTEMF